MIQTNIIRDSKKKIPNTCRGFFDDYRHLEEQFKSLTGTQGLVERVEENFLTQIGRYSVNDFQSETLKGDKNKVSKHSLFTK